MPYLVITRDPIFRNLHSNWHHQQPTGFLRGAWLFQTQRPSPRHSGGTGVHNHISDVHNAFCGTQSHHRRSEYNPMCSGTWAWPDLHNSNRSNWTFATQQLSIKWSWRIRDVWWFHRSGGHAHGDMLAGTTFIFLYPVWDNSINIYSKYDNMRQIQSKSGTINEHWLSWYDFFHLCHTFNGSLVNHRRSQGMDELSHHTMVLAW